MTSARRVRTTLRAPLRDAGFVEEGTQFVHRTHELAHRIEVTAVRRISGFVQIDHHIGLAAEPNAWLTQELASHYLGSSYPTIWAEAAVDARLVLDQAVAIRVAFRTVDDVAHFCSDRPHLAPPWAQGDASPSATPASLSEAETLQALARLGREILGRRFALAPPTESFDLWIGHAEVGGFRHGAYVEANVSSTLAVVVTFALPSKVFSRGFRHDDARRALWRAPKRVLFDGGRPVLLPLRRGALIDTTTLSAALDVHLASHPPNLLDDPADERAG
jgi:hypothetical protein